MRSSVHVSRGGLTFVIFAVLQLSGCASGDKSVAPPQTLATLAITAEAPTIEVLRGTVGMVPVSVLQSDGLTGAVTVLVENAPDGVTSRVSALPSETSARRYGVTLTVTTSTVPGVHTIRVRAERDGATAGTTTISVNVPESALVVAPGSVRMLQSATGSAAVRVFRPTGYRGDVTLSVSGAPAGLSMTVSPAVLTSSAEDAIVSVVSDGSPAEGSASVTLRAQGAGFATLSRSLGIVIVSPFRIALAGPSPIAVRGQVIPTLIVETREAEFGDNVTLSVSGLPPGVTSTIFRSPTNPLLNTIGFGVGANAPIGTHTITVTAVSSGPVRVTRTITLPLQIQ